MAEFISKRLSDALQGYRPLTPIILGAVAGGIGAYAAGYAESDNPLPVYVAGAVLVSCVLDAYVIEPLFENKQ